MIRTDPLTMEKNTKLPIDTGLLVQGSAHRSDTMHIIAAAAAAYELKIPPGSSRGCTTSRSLVVTQTSIDPAGAGTHWKRGRTQAVGPQMTRQSSLQGRRRINPVARPSMASKFGLSGFENATASALESPLDS